MNSTKVKSLLRHGRFRFALALLVIALTIGVFISFFSTHEEYLTALRHIKFGVILAVIMLYTASFITVVFIGKFTLELCGKKIPVKEQFLLSSYSSIINFFGPLQSGPGIRTVYLKAKHKVRVRDYILATLIYYAMFAMINALFLFGGSRPWWQALVMLLAVAAVCYSVIGWFVRRGRTSTEISAFHIDGGVISKLLLVTLLQVCVITTYYFVELHAVNPLVSLRQAVVYSGAANFSLFVALTPGAIGFRESFLLLSKQLHHISTGDILSANLVDRAVYLLFLLLLVLLTLGLHARTRLGIKKDYQS